MRSARQALDKEEEEEGEEEEEEEIFYSLCCTCLGGGEIAALENHLLWGAGMFTARVMGKNPYFES